jgi:PHD/YefM family antitoxin component YafN of YafNO toxin-antitoxin module
MDEWNGIQETLFLQTIPGMVESIKEAAREHLEDSIDAAELNYDV